MNSRNERNKEGNCQAENLSFKEHKNLLLRDMSIHLELQIVNGFIPCYNFIGLQSFQVQCMYKMGDF